MKKEKVLKILIYLLYIFLFACLSYFTICFFFWGTDCLGISFGYSPICNDISFYHIDEVEPWFNMLFYYGWSYFLSSRALYVFSYHLYTGKKNWYKFFREKEKQQKLQNKQEWQEYLKSLENEKKN